MPDYTQFIGGSTTMLIRDTGGNVEFWIRTGSQTWNNEQPWSYFANGGNSPLLHARMVRGGNWQMFGAVYVGYDQDVRFTIINSGLGFPTYDFWVHIQRSTVPPPPTMQSTVALSTSTIRASFTGNGDGGSPIQEWQLGYGSDPNYPTSLLTSNGLSDVSGFTSGQLVYFWARGRNLLGWSGWSNRLSASTWRIPDPPQPVTFAQVGQSSVRAVFVGGYDGGTAIIQYQLGYGLSSVSPQITVISDGTTDLSGLSPGKTYYFWARGQNSVGWGPWSERRQVTLFAGARVLVGNTWFRAVPYVRVGGVWLPARTFVKDAGIWKEVQG